MEHITEILLEAWEELKRLEHIIYVSLKYTRTVDIILNAINRLISIYDLVIEAYLEKAKKDGLVEALPKSPASRANVLSELYKDDAQLQKYLSYYHFLKNVLKSPYNRREEFRRHVTLVVELENCTAEIDIDNLTNCEKFTKKFFFYAKEQILGPKAQPEQ